VKLGVIGGGAWGTALAQVAARGGRETLLWAMEADVVEAINARSENSLFLPSIALDPAIRATSDLDDLSHCDAWLVVTPAQHMRAVLEQTPACDKPMVLCAKGIEERSGKLLHEVAREACPGARIAVLSGPTFAHEVAKGLPTAVTLAADQLDLAEELRSRIALPAFRIYVSDDVTVLWPAGKGETEPIGPAEVQKRYGVRPDQVPDFIALRGDPSDGLPGAKGIGEKTARDLLREYGTLDALLELPRGLTPRVYGSLRDQADELRAFRAIAAP